MAFGRHGKRATSPEVSNIIPFDPTIVGEGGEKLPAGEYLDEIYARRLGSVVRIPNEGLGGPSLHLSLTGLVAFEKGLEPAAQRAGDEAEGLAVRIRNHFGLDI